GIPIIRLLTEVIREDEIFLLRGDRVAEESEKRLSYEKKQPTEKELMDFGELVKLVREMSEKLERLGDKVAWMEVELRKK
ncbi:MAG: hypothetical protein AAB316_08075, partial [Bacteroidota bacterium]